MKFTFKIQKYQTDAVNAVCEVFQGQPFVDGIRYITADDVVRTSASRFRFSMCGINPGDTIEFYNNPSITCIVADDTHVQYEGETYSLTALAKKLQNTDKPLAGPKYFKYKGEWLNVLRRLNS